MESKTEMTTVVASIGPSEQVLAFSGKRNQRVVIHENFMMILYETMSMGVGKYVFKNWMSSIIACLVDQIC